MRNSLNALPISGKVAVSLFLILLWYGYFLSALNARLAVGTTVESIAEHYADQTLSKSEARAVEERGFVEEEVELDHDKHPEARSESITPQEMVQLGHVHILGFSFLFISLGIILFLSGIGEGWKVLILSLLFLLFSFDIGGLFLVRFASSRLAVIPFISGIGIGAGIAIISVIALYDMWMRKGST